MAGKILMASRPWVEEQIAFNISTLQASVNSKLTSIFTWGDDVENWYDLPHAKYSLDDDNKVFAEGSDEGLIEIDLGNGTELPSDLSVGLVYNVTSTGANYSVKKVEKNNTVKYYWDKLSESDYATLKKEFNAFKQIVTTNDYVKHSEVIGKTSFDATAADALSDINPASAKAVKTAIAAEATARQSADDLLLPKANIVKTADFSGSTSDVNPPSVKAVKDAIESANSGEATARDTAISNAITAEVNNRNAAISEAVAAEATARDTAIESAVSTEETARDTAISEAVAAEATARNTAIESAISAEETARDTAIESAVSAETTARQNAITSVEGAVSAEATARQNADNLKLDKSAVIPSTTNSPSSENASDVNPLTEKATWEVAESLVADETSARQTADNLKLDKSAVVQNDNYHSNTTQASDVNPPSEKAVAGAVAAEAAARGTAISNLTNGTTGFTVLKLFDEKGGTWALTVDSTTGTLAVEQLTVGTTE